MDQPTVRDAHDGDVGVIAELTDIETGAAERLVRDRRVVVAEREGDVVGVVAYEASSGAVHITRLAGETAAVAALLDEPIAFARAEGIDVEALVPDAAGGALDAVTNAGFEAVGDGPRFDGERTTRYRLAVDENA
ncbi:hypothetical protein [Halarchaeum nitratireducens]|uniref:N-acetyltransferase domain-containing protein n=1 Tax=Halarchaeum nitratireducens TaxID=489913 RepID=A0A830GHH3_9EURY|nr:MULTISPECIES: hypothetical protein [Halarchaeum]MBP2252857.1 hypothetical protein [Halarchaeum solikamskense]GGN26542.1 hypothetical protein GCM10009021_31190 [Halarchaeum nitratireducens]